jgi:hypothetical protein
MGGIVEVERDGLIYRGEFVIEGKMVTVTYGGTTKRLAMGGDADAPACVARQLLAKVLTELQD